MSEMTPPAVTHDAECLAALDRLLAGQGKLTEDIRHQRRLLHALSQAVVNLKEESPAPTAHDELSEMLMQGLDSLWNFLQKSRSALQALLDTVPAKGPFWKRSKPTWRAHLEETLGAYVEGMELVEKKLTRSLLEAGIVRILPNNNDLFNPLHHRAIEAAGEGGAKRIKEVIKAGYLKDGEVLRFADVTIH